MPIITAARNATAPSRPLDHATAVGRVLLVRAAPAAIDTTSRGWSRAPLPQSRIPASRVELAEIRERGYGTIEEQCVQGGRGVAVPVRNAADQVVVALDIVPPRRASSDDPVLAHAGRARRCGTKGVAVAKRARAQRHDRQGAECLAVSPRL